MLKISRDQHSNIVQAGQGRKQRDLLGSISRLNNKQSLFFAQVHKLVGILTDQYVCTMQWCQKTGGVRKIGGKVGMVTGFLNLVSG